MANTSCLFTTIDDIKNQHDSQGIVVSYNIGTTWTAVAWAMSTNGVLGNLHIVDDWPVSYPNSQPIYTVPTRVSYASDNRRDGPDLFGHEVPINDRMYTLSKLLLDEQATQLPREMNALRLDDRQEIRSSMFTHGPSGKRPEDIKTPEEVLTYFASWVYKRTMNHIAGVIGKDAVDDVVIHHQVLHPAAWLDETRKKYEQMMRAAGMGTRNADTLSLVSEPEAALVRCLSDANLDEIQDKIALVLDLRGGTLDVSAYRVESTNPLVLKQELYDDGLKSGSLFIDLEFVRYMRDTYQDAFTDVALEVRVHGSDFMEDFEKVKREFDGHSLGMHRIKLKMKPSKRSLAHDQPLRRYNERYREVILTIAFMKSFFAPVLDNAIWLLKKQLQKLAHQGKRDDAISIYVVGGLATSPYMIEQLKSWAEEEKIKLVQVSKPQLATVVGAVTSAGCGLTLKKYVTPCAFGYGYNAVFRKGIDPEYSRLEGNLCGRVCWLVPKGEALVRGADWSQEYNPGIADANKHKPFSIALFASNLGDLPEYSRSSGVRQIGMLDIDMNQHDFDWNTLKSDKSTGRTRYHLPLLIRAMTHRGAPDEKLFIVATLKNREDIFGTVIVTLKTHLRMHS